MIPVPNSGLAPAEWPPNVIARFVTVGGALVDVTEYADEKATQAKCGGCGKYDTTEWPNDTRFPGSNASFAADDAAKWSQEHAESCRALPKPGGAR